MDSALLVSIFPRELYFLMAAVSMDHKYLKHILRFTNIITTVRPQDVSYTGEGHVVSLEGDILKGKDTKWKNNKDPKHNLSTGDHIKLKDMGKTFYISQVIDDTTLEVTNTDNIRFTKEQNILHTYTILPKIDQSQVYSQGYQVLKDNGVFAIFPEVNIFVKL